MIDPPVLKLPDLHEHDFRSTVPLIGPFVSFTRRWLYRLTARWGVYSVIQQQNQINYQLTQYLIDLVDRVARLERQVTDDDLRLIEQDRDVAYLSRVIAELEIQQRSLLQRVQVKPDSSEPADKTGAGR